MPSRAPRAAAAPRRRRAASSSAPGDALDRFDFQADSLGYALRRAQVRAYELFHEMLAGMDLSPARLTALSIIATQPDTNQAALARQLGIAGPSVLKLVDALEDAGLVCRLDVAQDRRRYALALTATGRSRMEALRKRLDAYEARLASDLSAGEREQLLALLRRVAR
jgi:DNA-binding MarR family transcriptional regulator